MNENLESQSLPPSSLIERIIRFCLQNRVIVLLMAIIFIGWGLVVAPFDWHLSWLPRDPVPVDAICVLPTFP